MPSSATPLPIPPVVPPGETRIALPMDRIMAGLVDGLFWMVSLLPTWFCLTLYHAAKVQNWASLNWLLIFPWAAGICCFLAQGWMQASRGQSIGKSLLRLRVVSATGSDDEPPGFFTGVIVRWLLMWVFYVVPIVALVDFIFLFRDDRRCLHDHLAGTRVIAMDE
ncbi:MAG: RDD family protein [Opitutaceae bacterium]|nr:RDD family protein [Opitutaceae bacterium]